MSADTPATSAQTDTSGSVFRHRLFLIIWSGALLSNLGNWMENSAQNWAVAAAHYDRPGQSAFMTELLNFADFVPALFLVLIAGVLTDRLNLKRYLLWLQLLACILGTGLAVAALLGWATPWVVIAFTFAEGIVWALNGPPWQTVVPHLVPRAELPKAIAANSAQFNLARLVGPFLAGMVILHLNLATAFFINAASFIPVIWAITRLPANPRERKPAPKTSLLKDITSGLHIVRDHPGLRRLSIMQSTFMFFAAPLQGLLAVYVAQVMHGDSRLYGIMLGAIGAGALSGALIIGRVPRHYPRHHLIPLCMCLACVFMLLFSFTTTPWTAFPILFLSGFFWMLSMNSSNAANQLLASEEHRGRVLSVMLLCIQGSLPLGHLFAAMLTHWLSPQWVIRVMLGTSFFLMLAFLMKREPAIDDMQRRGTRKENWLESLWEAITAQSHKPIPQPLREELANEQISTPPRQA